MYEYLDGVVASRKPTALVLEVHGVAYRLAVSLATLEALPKVGARARVWTWLKVAEDELSLYGFATVEERSVFLELVEGVDGLGPRRAMAILSGTAPAELRAAIEAGDAVRLRRVRGIGPKLADKIIFALKGKLPKDEGMAPEAASKRSDAVQALVQLGYVRAEAESAVERVLKAAGQDDLAAEELVRRSLHHV